MYKIAQGDYFAAPGLICYPVCCQRPHISKVFQHTFPFAYRYFKEILKLTPQYKREEELLGKIFLTKEDTGITCLYFAHNYYGDFFGLNECNTRIKDYVTSFQNNEYPINFLYNYETLQAAKIHFQPNNVILWVRRNYED